MSGPLRALVPPAWRPALAEAMATPSFQSLEAFLAEEWAHQTIFPPREQIFAALAATPPEAVKAVILGQDPYPTAGNANGLAFSVADGVKVPASLRNLFTGLGFDVGLPKPTGGNLMKWAQHGVLLLNTVLTVREGAPNSHRKKGWEPFTSAVLSAVDRQPGPVVFFCFGNQARDLVADLVDAQRHLVLVTPHPSPLNGPAFVEAVKKAHPFSAANERLVSAGRGPIDWSL